MAKRPPPPPPPPPPSGGKKAPPPPPKTKKAPPPPPPKPKKAPPPPKTKKAPPPPKPKKRPTPLKTKRAPRRGAKKAPAKKGRPPTKKGTSPRKRGRRIKIKLGLRQNRLSQDEDTYHDQVGWTISQEVLEPLEDIEEDQEPEAVSHQCSMCGSIMQIPQPKRERYKVICAYPECGHEDSIGF